MIETLSFVEKLVDFITQLQKQPVSSALETLPNIAAKFPDCSSSFVNKLDDNSEEIAHNPESCQSIKSVQSVAELTLYDARFGNWSHCLFS